MSALFGRKREEGKTALVVDIENGSVGSALVYLSPQQPPKLFGEVRRRAPLLFSRSAHELSRHIEKAAREALIHVGEVAVRLRAHPNLAHLGTPSHGHIFLHAPWSTMSFNDAGYPMVAVAEDFLSAMRSLHTTTLGEIPFFFHAFGATTAPLLPPLYEITDDSLICVVSSEVVELLLISGGAVAGYATIPFGTHTLLRTLTVHGGMSEHEARSLFTLSYHHGREALDASVAHYSAEVRDVARELLANHAVGEVFVVAHEPYAEWFAQALTHSELENIFTSGGRVRAVRPHHITPYLAAHARKPDLALMLGSLFADYRPSVI